MLKINQNTSLCYVLSDNKSKDAHLEDFKKPWQDLLARAGIADFRLHDMRRTMGSMQAITGISTNIIGDAGFQNATTGIAGLNLWQIIVPQIPVRRRMRAVIVEKRPQRVDQNPIDIKNHGIKFLHNIRQNTAYVEHVF